MSYADRAAEHRRFWTERADTAEQLAAQHPEATARPYLEKMARQARRHARWPYWAVWALDLLGHWSGSLLIAAGFGFWVWWLADGDLLDGGWLSWVVAAAGTLLMAGNVLIGYRLHRRIAAERRRLQEWSERPTK